MRLNGETPRIIAQAHPAEQSFAECVVIAFGNIYSIACTRFLAFDQILSPQCTLFLNSRRRGRRFDSCHSDHKKRKAKHLPFFVVGKRCCVCELLNPGASTASAKLYIKDFWRCRRQLLSRSDSRNVTQEAAGSIPVTPAAEKEGKTPSFFRSRRGIRISSS